MTPAQRIRKAALGPAQKCPQRANRSAGNVIEYTRLMLAGNTLEQIGAEYGVTSGAVRKALQTAGLPTNSRMLLASVPEGCTPTDAAVLRAANHALAQENHELKARLLAIRVDVAEVARANIAEERARADALEAALRELADAVLAIHMEGVRYGRPLTLIVRKAYDGARALLKPKGAA